MIPTREGRFKANILEHGLDETGPNALATFICKFALLQEWTGGEWIPVDEDWQITGYFYLEKKDATINTGIIDSLKSAFGWDGRDPLWLADADFSDLIVQVKLEFEQYQGRQKLKVRYVDHENATGSGVSQADESTRQSLSVRLGAKLRALAGQTPAAMPQGRPSSPCATASAPVAPNARATPAARPSASVRSPSAPVATAETATMQQAWEAFTKECPSDWSRQELESEWFRILSHLHPNKAVEAITPEQWAKVIAEAPSLIFPA